MKNRSSLNRQKIISFCLVLVFTANISKAAGQDQHSNDDHSQHTASDPATQVIPVEAAEVQAAVQQAMNHENSNMDSAESTSGRRDPHAYANGYSLIEGPYALPASEQTSLSDQKSFNKVLFNRFEHIDNKDKSDTRYDIQVWLGKTYNRLVVKTEGVIADNSLQDNKAELLWSRAVTPFWDAQLGMRFDNGDGPARRWLAAGIQGLAHYLFDIHATAFLGDGGRTAVGFEAEYDARLTQRLTLKPRVDINFYGKSDLARAIGSGLSDATIGLRLQYQFSRQFAPYLGIERIEKFGETADLVSTGDDIRNTRWVAGIRFWF